MSLNVQPFDITQLAAAYKVKYPHGLAHLSFEACPWHAQVNRVEDLDGLEQKVPINGQFGVAYNNYTASYENAEAAKPVAFTVTPVRTYVHGFFDILALKASRNSDAALESALDMGIESVMTGFERHQEFSLINNGGGARAQLDSGVTLGSTNGKVRDVRTIRWLQPGMVIRLAPDDGVSASAGVRDTHGVKVVTVDYTTGEFTVDANFSTITSATADDFIFAEGEYQNMQHGLKGWCPVADADLSTDFLGVNQTLDPLNYAGSRIDVSGASTEEGIIEGLAQARQLGQKINQLWVSPARMADLAKDIESKAMFTPSEMKTPTISISSIKVRGGYGGTCDIMELPGLEDDRIFATRSGIWSIRSVDSFPHFSEEQSGRMIHVQNADRVMFVLAAYGDYVCTHPRDNSWFNFV